MVAFDDDHNYMGSVLVELLVGQGCTVMVIKPAPSIAEWLAYTLEQPHILHKLRNLGVGLQVNTQLTTIESGRVQQHSSLKSELCC